MNMSKETLELIQQTAVRARGLDVVPVDQEPRHVYYLRQADGELKRCEAAVEPRDHELYSLDDVVAAVKLWGGDAPVVFCGRQGIRVALGDLGARRDTLQMTLEYSEQFVRLESVSEQPMMQKGFLDLLRIELFGCVPAEFVLQIRNLKFGKHVDGTGVIGDSKESLGQQVQREILTGGAELPSGVTVTTGVYKDLIGQAPPAAIECALRLDLSELTLTLVPKAGELNRAVREADAWLRDYLANRLPDVTVLCGRP